jgi:GT2 family glycosyltransferase
VARVSIVVVSFNSRSDLAGCLDSLDPRAYEVVVVDNASCDGSAAFVRSRYPAARVLALSENIGFGAAANRGIEASWGDYVLVLNPDARAVGSAITDLVSCLNRDPRVGAAGPQLERDGRPQDSFLPVPSLLWTGRPPVSSHPRRRPVSAAGLQTRRRRMILVGAAILLRREALWDAGAFDPDFFMFFEDVDLCWRLQERGWDVTFCPGARFVHSGGASTKHDWPRLYREQLRGHLRFLAKTRGFRAAAFSRRWLIAVVAARGAGANADRRAVYWNAARWLASNDLKTLLVRGRDEAKP